MAQPRAREGKVRFERCIITGPDGVERSGWSGFVGERFFGKALTKQALLDYRMRLLAPALSYHWKNLPRQSWGGKGVKGRKKFALEEESGEEVAEVF